MSILLSLYDTNISPPSFCMNISVQTEPLISDETEPVISAKCATC